MNIADVTIEPRLDDRLPAIEDWVGRWTFACLVATSGALSLALLDLVALAH